MTSAPASSASTRRSCSASRCRPGPRETGPTERVIQNQYWSTRMKAARLENGVLQIQELPTPTPGHEEALIRMRSAGVCHSDLHIARGDWTGIPSTMPLGHE